MENIVGINNNLLIKWTLLRNDGEPFPLSECMCRIFITSGRGRSEVREFSVTGVDKNIVSWETNIPTMHTLGQCSVSMEILRKGRQIAKADVRDAFRIVSSSPKGCDCRQRIELFSFVSVLHPDEVPGAVNVLFPKLEVDENMHLHISGDTENFNSNFEMDQNGHLLFHND